MRKSVLWYSWALVWFPLLAGCLGTYRNVKVERGGAAPGWVLEPSKPGYYSAVGMCGQTLFRKDAVEHATEDALGNLAIAVQVEVKSVVLQMTTKRGTEASQTQVVEASRLASDLVMSGAEIQGIWVDRKGAVDAPQTTYAIARISKSAVRKAVPNMR